MWSPHQPTLLASFLSEPFQSSAGNLLASPQPLLSAQRSHLALSWSHSHQTPSGCLSSRLDQCGRWLLVLSKGEFVFLVLILLITVGWRLIFWEKKEAERSLSHHNSYSVFYYYIIYIITVWCFFFNVFHHLVGIYPSQIWLFLKVFFFICLFVFKIMNKLPDK